MKKIICLTAIVATLSACSVHKLLVPPTFTAKDLVGEWVCSAEYAQFGDGRTQINTNEKYTYSADGKAHSRGKLVARLLDVEFEYKIQSAGNYNLNGWLLKEKATDIKYQRAFSKKSKEAMKKAEYKHAVSVFEDAFNKDIQLALKSSGLSVEVETLNATTLITKLPTGSQVFCER